jgi:hypothetical protein
MHDFTIIDTKMILFIEKSHYIFVKYDIIIQEIVLWHTEDGNVKRIRCKMGLHGLCKTRRG